MKLTIVADDNSVGVDGKFFSELALPQLDPTIHAVQWYGEFGEVEFKTVFLNGALTKQPNELISNILAFQFALDAWTAAKLADEQAQIDNAFVIPVTEV